MTRFYMVGGNHTFPVVYTEHNAEAVKYGRPVVVIDPDDRDAVERLTRGFAQDATVEPSFEHLAAKVAAALREYANPTPPKARVYEHVVSRTIDGLATSLCGKVWLPGKDVEVIGKCPDCLDRSERWSA